MNYQLITENNNILTIYPNAILFHYQKEKEPDIKFRECNDTGKIGCYLTDSHNIALGNACENILSNVSLSRRFFIHSYRVTKTLDFTRGKYSFRNISPERYFDKSGKLIPNVNPNENENVSHYDFILPFIDDDNYPEELEIFITKDEERNSLQYIRSESILI